MRLSSSVQVLPGQASLQSGRSSSITRVPGAGPPVEEKLNKTHFSLKCNFRFKLSLKNDPKVKRKLGHVY